MRGGVLAVEHEYTKLEIFTTPYGISDHASKQNEYGNWRRPVRATERDDRIISICRDATVSPVEEVTTRAVFVQIWTWCHGCAFEPLCHS